MAKTELKTADDLGALILRKEKQFGDMLPVHLNMKWLQKTVMAAAHKTPKILQCTPTSIMLAVEKAAQLGIDASSITGKGYLIPYGKECTFIIGYRGLIELAMRSGLVANIHAHVIYKNDKYKIRYGSDPILEHEPTLGDPGEAIAVYAMCFMKDGSKMQDLMTIPQVEKIRKGSPGKNSPAWKDHYDEMAKKTIVRRLCKYLPQSPEVELGLTITAGSEEPIDVEVEPNKATPALDLPPTKEQKEEAKPPKSTPKQKETLAPVNKDAKEAPAPDPAPEQAETVNLKRAEQNLFNKLYPTAKDWVSIDELQKIIKVYDADEEAVVTEVEMLKQAQIKTQEANL